MILLHGRLYDEAAMKTPRLHTTKNCPVTADSSLFFSIVIILGRELPKI